MKVICLLCDSLNRHFLHAYGEEIAETPNLDWFASKAHVFNKHFSGSVPTMPARRELWTGNYEFLWRPWGALEPWDKGLIRMLANNDVLTMLITDSYHLFETGSGNYHFNFEGWEFLRGFENDPWVTDPVDPPEHHSRPLNRYARSMTRMNRETDLPCAKTMICVEEWLQKNYTHENMFLMIDEFAPHEPFYTPEYLVKQYDPDWDGPLFFWPKYGKDLYNEKEIRHLRAAYSAHVTLLDKYIGRVFETMSDLNMWEDTAFIIMTDHGHYLGDHGYTGKPPCPQHNTLVHIPFMMYVPGYEGMGRRIDALTANVDVYPTILDLFGIEPESEIDGRSLLPLAMGETGTIRDWTLYGYFGRQVNITDGTVTYLRPPQNSDADLNIYSLRWEFGRFKSIIPAMEKPIEIGNFMKKVDMPVGKLRVPTDMFWQRMIDTSAYMFDIDKDPAQEHNLAGSEQEDTYKDLLKHAMKKVDAPQEQFERMGL